MTSTLYGLSLSIGLAFLLTLLFVAHHGPEIRRRLVEKMVPIKTSLDRSVYALDKDKIRHFIPDWNTFVSSGFDVTDIRTVTDAEMQSYPLGDPMGQIEEIAVQPEGCPCSLSPEYEEIKSQKSKAVSISKICLVKTNHAMVLFDQTLPEEFMWVSNLYNQTYFQAINEMPQDLSTCTSVIEIIGAESASMIKYSCPEQCLPVPFSQVPLPWLTADMHSHPLHSKQFSLSNREHSANLFDPHIPLTCSMTFAQVLGVRGRVMEHHLVRNSSQPQHAVHTTPAEILRDISNRRFEECNEQPYWPSNHTLHLSIERRHVHGFILWVGSTTRYDLMLRQITILHNQTTTPSAIVAGWMASEAQYDCRLGSTLCPVYNDKSYFTGMPVTRLNMAANGWACAQRRPLRALAHTLLLYDPNYILLVDDDTYVSRDLILSSSFNRFAQNALSTSLGIYGQLTKGRKITRKGFYYGGAGYLIGKKIVDRLHGKELLGPDAYSTGMIDPTQMRSLSVLYETVSRASQHCPTKCYTNITKVDAPQLTMAEIIPNVHELSHLTATLTVRVIDMCTRIMSQEHTCYHSDHAISRCMVHGVYAGPYMVECGGSDLPDGLLMGMCMGTDNCDSKVHLTCHRWQADAHDPSKAVNI